MKTEHYFCDQCKKEVEIEGGKALLIKICCGVGSPYVASYRCSLFDKFKEYDLCFDCAYKVGFKVKEKGPVTAPPGIEERLYGIILEIIESCKENAQ